MVWPSVEVWGQSETVVVWMSDAGIPACLSASTIACACCESLLSASAAVVAFTWTPKSKDALSGVASTEPLPVTVMVVGDELAAPPFWGCATPAMAAATSKASEQAQAIIDALKNAGVPASDIQTSSVSLWPQTSTDGQTITGFQASNSVSVSAPIGKSGSLVDAAVTAGANNINGPNLSVGDQSSYYANALKLAVDDAKTQAQAIADAAGLTLGGITHIENSGSTPTPIYYGSSLAMDSAKVATPIQAGSQQIQATVTVTYSAS